MCKNPVGRPKKNQQNIVDVNFKNIIPDDNTSNDIVSFSLKDLTLFKQIINLFKLLTKDEFYISFSHNTVQFFITDEPETNVIIDSQNLIDYAVINPITISCITVKMNDILSNVNSNYHLALFSVTQEYNVKLKLINSQIQEHNISYIHVDRVYVEPNTVNLNLPIFTVFEIPVKLLKKKLIIFNKQCETFEIEIKNNKVVFNFYPLDKFGKFITEYIDMEKINCKNIIESKITININTLLSFSNLSLAENIIFYISQGIMYCQAILNQQHIVTINIPIVVV